MSGVGVSIHVYVCLCMFMYIHIERYTYREKCARTISVNGKPSDVFRLSTCSDMIVYVLCFMYVCVLRLFICVYFMYVFYIICIHGAELSHSQYARTIMYEREAV